jgi:bacteriocin-like protein
MTTEKTTIPNKASDIKKAADPAAPKKNKESTELDEEELEKVSGGGGGDWAG